MEQQTVEVKFQGERVGSYIYKNTTHTLYSVPGKVVSLNFCKLMDR